MKKVFSIILIATACSTENNKVNVEFSPRSISTPEWETYEGRWLTNDGIVRLELSLSTSSNNIDSYYRLSESFESDKYASNTVSNGKFTINHEVLNEFCVRLHDLTVNSERVHFRVKESTSLDSSEEMFFTTRDGNELIPTDEDFKPITLDGRYTLHKRLNYITVEGYITFENDSAEYFERNTMQYWKVANFGEFDELKTKYKQLTKEKYEGLYLKALAYAVSDKSTPTERALVIKRIKAIGNDPEVTNN